MNLAWWRAGAMLVALVFGRMTMAAEVEVQHWWTSSGEARAVEELRSQLAAKGVVLRSVPVNGGGGEAATTVLKSRVMSGNSPGAAQAKSPGIQTLAADGIAEDISAVARSEKWDAVLPKAIADGMKYRGKYVAAPVNVHRGNWMWVNPALLSKAGVSVPATWEEFAIAAERLKAVGVTPIAHGGQPWQELALFEDIVLSVGGADFYRQAFVELSLSALEGRLMGKSLRIFRSLRSAIDINVANRDWNAATSMVAEGKAAMQFMGDWAKGDLTANGRIPGKDFLCVAAPGTSNAFIYVVDSFVMPRQASESARKAQLQFASVAMGRPFQEAFNVRKGSIPVRVDADLSRYDDCARQSAKDFVAAGKQHTLVPSLAHGMAQPEEVRARFEEIVSGYFNSNQTERDALEALSKLARK